MKRFISLLMSLVLLIGMMVAAIPTAQAADANVITKKNPAVVIRTSFATGAYNKGWGGVFQAAPIKDAEGYVLYDVVIWEDRINLYKFPNNLEQNEKKGFNFAKNNLSTAAGQKSLYKVAGILLPEECVLQKYRRHLQEQFHDERSLHLFL